MVTDAGTVAVHVKRGGVEWRTVKPRAQAEWVGYVTRRPRPMCSASGRERRGRGGIAGEIRCYAESGGQVATRGG